LAIEAILTVARLIVTLTSLLPPAFLMGATFPAMIAGSAPDSPSRRTARAGYLYSVNTLGAAIGCFVAGFEFLFGFGVQKTLVCAFGLYLLAALCGLVATTIGRSKIVSAARETGPWPARDSKNQVNKPEAKEAAAAPIPLGNRTLPLRQDLFFTARPSASDSLRLLMKFF
jgi:MFS family permease